MNPHGRKIAPIWWGYTMAIMPDASHLPDRQNGEHLSCAETVLLVDDEEHVRAFLAHVLSKSGYKVLQASSGEEALRLFESVPGGVDLLLTDIVMPKMSGRELGECVNLARPATRVMYISAYADESLGSGISILPKPIHPDMLIAKVREALDSPSRPFDLH